MACASRIIRLAQPPRRGFTLIELLTVVAVMSLLLMILVPSLGRAKRLARVAVCLPNLKSLNGALALYSAESRDCLWRYTQVQNSYWINKLRPYHDKMEKIRFCPEATQLGTSVGSATRAWEALWIDSLYGYGSYGMNLWLFPMAGDSPYYSQFVPAYQGWFYRSLNSCPGAVPTFCDSNWIGSWPFDTGIVPVDLQNGWWVHQEEYFMGRFCIDRHLMSVCSAFVDGSARRVDLGDLWMLNWSAGFKTSQKKIP